MARKDRKEVIVLTEAEKVEKAKVIKKAEKKAANKEKKAAKKAAVLNILKFVNEQEDHGLAAEILLVTPGQRGAGGGGSSILDTFKDLFTEKVEVKGLELYQEYGKGQGEMRKIVRNLIRRLKPAERIWVHYNKPSDTYTLMGVGVDVPKGWTGYRPVEVYDVEIF